MAKHYRITHGGTYLILRGDRQHTVQEGQAAAVDAALAGARIDVPVLVEDMETDEVILRFTRRR